MEKKNTHRDIQAACDELVFKVILFSLFGLLCQLSKGIISITGKFNVGHKTWIYLYYMYLCLSVCWVPTIDTSSVESTKSGGIQTLGDCQTLEAGSYCYNFIC